MRIFLDKRGHQKNCVKEERCGKFCEKALNNECDDDALSINSFLSRAGIAE